jgi:glutathione S-transferase
VTAQPASERRLLDRLALAVIGGRMRRAQRPSAQADGWLTPSKAPPRVGLAGPRPLASLPLRDDLSLTAPDGSSDAAVFETALQWRQMTPVVRKLGPFAVSYAGETYADIPAAFDLVDVLAAQGPRLFPDDVWADTQIRQWLAFDASLHKEVKALEAAARGEKPPAGVLPVEAATAILGARFDQLDAHLSGRSWLVGDDLTIADRALATRVHVLDGLGASIGPDRPHLRDWVERTGSAL